METTPGRDRWAGSASYERFMGRWSRPLAHAFVDRIGLPPGAAWLEVGCGTGALTKAICHAAAPARVVACDPSAEYVEHARAVVPDARVAFEVRGADDLPHRPGGYDAVVSSLVLNFLPDPVRALDAMRVCAADGGVVAACVWDYGEGMAFLRHFWDAAAAYDPAARALDEGARFPICRPEALRDAFTRAGLADVDVTPLVIPTLFRDFDDYWAPFLGGPGPAPGYVASLDPARQAALAARVRQRLPVRADGAIPLTARAWVARGTAAGHG